MKETYLGAIADDDFCTLTEPMSAYLFPEAIEAIKGMKVRVRSVCTSYSTVYFSSSDRRKLRRSKHRFVREICYQATLHADSKVLYESKPIK